MKNMVSIALLGFILTSLTAAAGPLKVHEDLIDVLRSEVKTEQLTDVRGVELLELTKNLGTLAHLSGVDQDSLSVEINSMEGPVDLIAVSQALLSSSNILNDSSNVGKNLDRNAKKLKTAIEASNKVMAEFVLRMPKKVLNSNSDQGLFIGKMILMGRSISRGEYSTEKIDRILPMAKEMIRKIRNGEAQTAEQAVMQVFEH